MALNQQDETQPVDKTGPQFKKQFCDAHKALRCTMTLTINNSPNKDQMMNLVTGIHEYASGIPRTFHFYWFFYDTGTSEDSEPSPVLITADSVPHSANSTGSDLAVQTMLRQLEMHPKLWTCLQLQELRVSSFLCMRQERIIMKNGICWALQLNIWKYLCIIGWWWEFRAYSGIF